MATASLFIYCCISISGASILALEILGTRILGPFYGASLFLWSSLITVTLVALSVGYSLGGWWADRGPTRTRFLLLFLGSGIWILSIPWVQHSVIWAAEPMGLRTAVLFSATVLFLPPLVLLGMVGPYAIKLSTASLEEVGRSAGNVYAVSTAASVAAALLTGFYLIPHIGVRTLTALVGALLVATGGVGLALSRKGRAGFALALLPIIGASLSLPLIHGRSGSEDGGALVASDDSPYAEVRVLDRKGHRYLLIGGSVHTAIDIETGESLLRYVNVVDISRGFFTTPGAMLLVGLGGGAIVEHFAEAGWHVDAVEIDPVVVQYAFRYFGLDSSYASVLVMDGRRFLKSGTETYQVIILDAFGSGAIPFHLVSQEALEEAKRRLARGGVLVLNAESVGWKSTLVRSIGATLASLFEHAFALPIAEPPDQLGNVVLFASDRPLELDQPLPPPQWRVSEEYDRVHAWDNKFEIEAGDAKIITDDLNPIEILSERVNLVARKNLHEFFGRGYVGR